MRIAILADFPLHLLPGFGEEFRPTGHYATWLPQLHRQFAKRPELDIHWVVLSPHVKLPMARVVEGQRFHVLPTPRKGRASSFFRSDRARIRALLAELQPQLVHGWGTEDAYGLAAVTSGFRNIVSMQGILSHYVLKSRMQPRAYFQALLELYVLARASHITVESDWGRRRVRHRNPFARVSLVEYGVQDHFLSVPWNPDPSRPAALFSGSISPRKGIQDAVRAFGDPRLAGAELWIIGGEGGAFGEALQAEAGSNVKWLGRVPSAEAAALLAKAWCLVLPTRADTSPNVVKEARVIGLPVVTTPCGGQTQYVAPGRNGFLVAPGNTRELADRLSDLLVDLPRCRRMGEIGHGEQRRLLDPATTADGFAALYFRLGHGQVTPTF